MFAILEEMGITLGEVIGAGIVLGGLVGGLALFGEYGFRFIEALVG